MFVKMTDLYLVALEYVQKLIYSLVGLKFKDIFHVKKCIVHVE